MYNCSGVFRYFGSIENHLQTMIRYLKRLISSMFVCVKAFPTCMYGGMGVSTPSLHRESTDSDMSYEKHNSHEFLKRQSCKSFHAMTENVDRVVVANTWSSV